LRVALNKHTYNFSVVGTDEKLCKGVSSLTLNKERKKERKKEILWIQSANSKGPLIRVPILIILFPYDSL
jgi:predicted nucleic acid-binding Zn ribbon protein